MENLLNDVELGNVKTAIKTVQETATLQQWVYPMKVTHIERATDKHGDAQLKLTIDTGFKKINSTEPRCFLKFYHLTGKYADGRDRVDELARFLKRSYKQKELSNESLKMIIGRNISVATTKDDGGYINFWYAGPYEELNQMRQNYKFKIESNSPTAGASVMPECMTAT